MKQPALAPTAEDARFYANLPEFDRFVDVATDEHYAPAPDSWLLVITDVIGSTRAIEAGRYKDVNAVGVSCIVAVKNALGNLDFPYVFGGDGATLLVPHTALDAIAEALHGVARTAEVGFDLQLRLGAVPVADLRADGFELRVARFRASDDASFAMFAGSALAEAERRVKHPDLATRYALPPPLQPSADLQGLECRWRPIPSRNGQIVSLLVQALGSEAHHRDTYARIVAELDRVTRGIERSGPLHQAGLRFAFIQPEGDQEARLFSQARGGWSYWRRRLHILYLISFGWLLLFFGKRAGDFDGARYLQQMIANSDFRKFDGTLRLVLDLDDAQLAALRQLLQAERQRGKLAYGIHTAGSSLMTCVISSYDRHHVHFIDGAEGGYALAARELKAQLKS